MGSVFKKTLARPLPPDAEIIERKGVTLARWRDTQGRGKTAPVIVGQDGAERIRDESRTYFARYRGGDNLVVEVSTKCRDESAARQVLADLERKAERVRAGLLTPAEARTSEHLTRPIGEHAETYAHNLEASGATAKHVRESRRILNTVLSGCGFRTFADPDREPVEHWLSQRRTANASARTRNTDRATLIAFANWCADPSIGRLLSNPFNGLPRADEKADPRRRRRAMTEAELVRLLDADLYSKPRWFDGASGRGKPLATFGPKCVGNSKHSAESEPCSTRFSF